MNCSSCLKQITSLIAKRAGDKMYCPKCYATIMSAIKKTYNSGDDTDE